MADYYLAKISSFSDYGTFGELLEAKTANANRCLYGFNGKEKDSEWNSGGAIYDYGFRIYDPRIAKFLSVDPLSKSYPELTPYQFASNCPIEAIDLDGLENWSSKGKQAVDNSGKPLIGSFSQEFIKAKGLKAELNDGTKTPNKPGAINNTRVNSKVDITSPILDGVKTTTNAAGVFSDVAEAGSASLGTRILVGSQKGKMYLYQGYIEEKKTSSGKSSWKSNY